MMSFLLNFKNGLLVVLGGFCLALIFKIDILENRLEKSKKEAEIYTKNIDDLSVKNSELNKRIKQINISLKKEREFLTNQTKELNIAKIELRKLNDEKMSDGLKFAVDTAISRLWKPENNNTTTPLYRPKDNTTSH